MFRRKLLLHACCAPCLCYVYETLCSDYDIDVFYFNPNIYPVHEYHRRLGELERFCDLKQITVVNGSYCSDDWISVVSPYSDLGEKSQRCRVCYRFRLEETMKRAISGNYDVFSTTLSISPHKNAEWINDIGKELSDFFGVSYLEADFKKNNGYSQSVELSKKYRFYRQSYCGCKYSLNESEIRRNERKEKQRSLS